MKSSRPDPLAIWAARGYIQNPDGSISHRSRAGGQTLDQLATPQPSKQQNPLDQNHERQSPRPEGIQGGKARKPKQLTRPGSCGAACEISITLIACTPSPIDTDNLAGGFKPLRDAIAEWLGIDDGCPALRWEYHQADTRWVNGTVIIIQVHGEQAQQQAKDRGRTSSRGDRRQAFEVRGPECGRLVEQGLP